jgi:hypothetical protein
VDLSTGVAMSMWRIVGAVVIASVVLSGGAHAQSVRTSSQQQHEIQPLLDSMMVAANAHDTDRFLASYLHDSTLVFVFNGVVTVGFDNVRALQLKWWNGGKSDVVYSQGGPTDFLELAPDVVVVTNRSHRGARWRPARCRRANSRSLWYGRGNGRGGESCACTSRRFVEPAPVT